MTDQIDPNDTIARIGQTAAALAATIMNQETRLTPPQTAAAMGLACKMLLMVACEGQPLPDDTMKDKLGELLTTFDAGLRQSVLAVPMPDHDDDGPSEVHYLRHSH